MKDGTPPELEIKDSQNVPLTVEPRMIGRPNSFGNQKMVVELPDSISKKLKSRELDPTATVCIAKMNEGKMCVVYEFNEM